MYAHSQVCLYKKVLYKRDKIVGEVSLWSSIFTLKKWYYVPFDKSTYVSFYWAMTIDNVFAVVGAQYVKTPVYSYQPHWYGTLAFNCRVVRARCGRLSPHGAV